MPGGVVHNDQFLLAGSLSAPGTINAGTPMMNEWWQVPLYLTARGLGTSPSRMLAVVTSGTGTRAGAVPEARAPVVADEPLHQLADCERHDQADPRQRDERESDVQFVHVVPSSAPHASISVTLTILAARDTPMNSA